MRAACFKTTEGEFFPSRFIKDAAKETRVRQCLVRILVVYCITKKTELLARRCRPKRLMDTSLNQTESEPRGFT